MKLQEEQQEPTHGKPLPGTKPRKRPVAFKKRKLGKIAR